MNSLKQACVIGWPISHSRSPLIHNHWLEKYGIAGRYDKRAVEPEALAGFLASFRDELVGANVTIPHKEAVFERVSIGDELTAKLGSVNTLYLRDGKLLGTSTDGYGYVANLLQTVPDFVVRGANVVVLGAGGAAKSIVGALVERQVGKVTVANRSPERARQLAAMFGEQINPVGLEAVHDALPSADLLINTTSLGMTGKDDLALDVSLLPAHAVVSDIVYVPLITTLLEAAFGRGLRIVDGLGMLLHQAVPGFELWFGIRPEVTPELRAILEADIRG